MPGGVEAVLPGEVCQSHSSGSTSWRLVKVLSKSIWDGNLRAALGAMSPYYLGPDSGAAGPWLQGELALPFHPKTNNLLLFSLSWQRAVEETVSCLALPGAEVGLLIADSPSLEPERTENPATPSNCLNFHCQTAVRGQGSGIAGKAQLPAMPTSPKSARLEFQRHSSSLGMHLEKVGESAHVSGSLAPTCETQMKLLALFWHSIDIAAM